MTELESGPKMVKAQSPCRGTTVRFGEKQMWKILRFPVASNMGSTDQEISRYLTFNYEVDMS